MRPKHHNQSRDLWYKRLVALIDDMAEYIHDNVDILPTGKKIYTAEEKVLLNRMDEERKYLLKTKKQEKDDGL